MDLKTMAKTLSDSDYWRSVRDTAPASLRALAQGLTAGTLGAPVDLANMVLQPFGLGSERPVGGYNQLGRLMGANTNSVPYMVGSMLPISPSDMVHGLPLMAGIFAGKSAKTADLAKLMKTEKMRAVPVDQQIVRYGDDVARSIPNKTEFEIAHEVAQRNAALPLEQGGLGLPANNTAMDRAKAMGFDTPAYHGTGLQANADDPSGALIAPDYRDYIETSDNIPVRSALFTSTNPTVASGYATKKEGHVLPLLLNEGKQAWSDAKGKLWIDYFKQRGLPEANARTARNNGYDSYKIKNVIDPYTMDYTELADTIAMVNPSNIRSRFAAFDPFQRNSANILAGGAAGGIGINALHDLMNQEEYQ